MSSQTQTDTSDTTPWYKRKPLVAGLGAWLVLRIVRKARRAAARRRDRVALKELRKEQRRQAYAEHRRAEREKERRRAERDAAKRQRKALRRIRRRAR